MHLYGFHTMEEISNFVYISLKIISKFLHKSFTTCIFCAKLIYYGCFIKSMRRTLQQQYHISQKFCLSLIAFTLLHSSHMNALENVSRIPYSVFLFQWHMFTESVSNSMSWNQISAHECNQKCKKCIAELSNENSLESCCPAI